LRLRALACRSGVRVGEGTGRGYEPCSPFDDGERVSPPPPIGQPPFFSRFEGLGVLVEGRGVVAGCPLGFSSAITVPPLRC